MKIEVTRAPADEVEPLRELHRHLMHCQIIHDSFLRRGFCDPYLIRADGRIAGYGLVANKHYPDHVDEFYLSPGYRDSALPMFRELIAVGGAKKIRIQTNDLLMLQMFYDCATNVEIEAILFQDECVTHLPCPGGVLRKITEEDKQLLEERKMDSGSQWMIEDDGVPVATGGVLYHYNPPYGDIFMEVHESRRQRGYGSYMVQELKRIAYESGKIPAARCNADNVASRRTLQRAGFLPCGRLMTGDIANP